jgi:hypothetical protein
MKNTVSKEVSFTGVVAAAGRGLVDALFEDFNRRQALEKENAKAQAVQAITDAIFEGNRVSIDTVRSLVPGSLYMNRRELAEKLDITLDFFNAGVKRWFHF